MRVKFVDDGSYFVELDGPSVVLKSSNPISASATVQVTAPAEIDDGDYFFINTPTRNYYIWMDKSGDGTANPNPSGFDTDSAVLVNISSSSVASDVATAIQSAINGTDGLSATVNSDGDIEIDVDDSGTCDAPYDYNTGFNFIEQLDGEDSGGIIKSAIPNNDNSIVDIYDVAYDASIDEMKVLCKVKDTISLGKNVGTKTIYKVEVQTVNGFIF